MATGTKCSVHDGIKLSTVSVTALCMLLLLAHTDNTAVAMTTNEQQEIVAIHNALRRGEGSSNMQILTWNPTLSVIAQNWSDACVFAHGQGVNSSTLSNLNLGQNLFATSTSTVNLTSATISWFNEKADYTYANNSCAAGKVCGHYTQVVWAKSTQVGCGYTVCPTLSPIGYTNAVLLVCNYAPAGNIVGQLPYLKGTACTQCNGGQFYCNNGLCDSSCTSPSANCVCSAACQNCATLTSDCRCQCGTGWTGVDCSVVCSNTNSLCNNGWYTSWCEPTHQYVLDGCPAMCGQCVAGTPSSCLPGNISTATTRSSGVTTSVGAGTSSTVITTTRPSAMTTGGTTSTAARSNAVTTTQPSAPTTGVPNSTATRSNAVTTTQPSNPTTGGTTSTAARSNAVTTTQPSAPTTGGTSTAARSNAVTTTQPSAPTTGGTSTAARSNAVTTTQPSAPTTGGTTSTAARSNAVTTTQPSAPTTDDTSSAEHTNAVTTTQPRAKETAPPASVRPVTVRSTPSSPAFYPARGTCLVAKKSQIFLRYSPASNKIVAKVTAGENLISLGLHSTADNGTRWLKVRAVSKRSPIGWIKADNVRTGKNPRKKNGKTTCS